MKSPMIGSISTGTMRTEDLMPAFAEELSLMPAISDRDSAYVRRVTLKLLYDVEKFLEPPEDSSPDWDSEEAQWLMESLFDELDNHAPLHMRFGSHDGDGADFGFWPTDFDDCEHMDEIVGKNGEVEFYDFTCDIYVHVNDHGNIAVHKADIVADGTGSHRTYKGEIIWDCV